MFDYNALNHTSDRRDECYKPEGENSKSRHRYLDGARRLSVQTSEKWAPVDDPGARPKGGVFRQLIDSGARFAGISFSTVTQNDERKSGLVPG